MFRENPHSDLWCGLWNATLEHIFANDEYGEKMNGREIKTEKPATVKPCLTWERGFNWKYTSKDFYFVNILEKNTASDKETFYGS